MTEPPKHQTQMERLYYRSVGAAFNPYVVTPDAHFDTALIEDMVPLSPVDVTAQMEGLIRYAMGRRFEEPGSFGREASVTPCRKSAI